MTGARRSAQALAGRHNRSQVQGLPGRSLREAVYTTERDSRQPGAVREAVSSRIPWWRRLWIWWKAVAQAIGDFQARVILGVFYYVVAFPVALGVRALSDPLRMRRVSCESYWDPLSDGELGVEAARRQH